MRLIDADALRELIDGGYDVDFDELPETKQALLEMIDYQDTIDAVEVVRCKDCKYRDDYDFCTGRGYPNALVPDDGFCDKGKRRD